MPDANLEITQKAMEDFKKIQEYMLLAKEKILQKLMQN